MLSLDLFNTKYERELKEGAVDDLEYRRIDDLAMRMDDLVARARTAKTPEARAALVREFQKCKDERDSYFKIKDECMGYGTLGEENVNEGAMKDMLWKMAERMERDEFIGHCVNEWGWDADEMAEFWDAINGPLDETGIPGNVPVEKIPGKEDLLKGRGRTYYESQKKNSEAVDEATDPKDPSGQIAIHDQGMAIPIASRYAGDGQFKVTIKNKPYIVTVAGWEIDNLNPGNLDSFYLTDVKTGKTEHVTGGWNYPEAVAIFNNLLTTQKPALQDIYKQDMAFYDEHGWNTGHHPERLQGLDKTVRSGYNAIPADRFIKARDDMKKVTGQQDVDEGRMGEIDAMRQDLERMTDPQFLRAYGMSKAKFQQTYRTLLKPAPEQDVPLDETTDPFLDNSARELLGLVIVAGGPAQQAAIAVAMKKAGKKPKQVDELDASTLKSYADKRGAQVAAMKVDNPNPATGSKEWIQQAVPAQQVNLAKRKIARKERQAGVTEDTGSWIVYDPETKQIKKRFKTHTAGKSYARTHGLGFASSSYYFDNIKDQQPVAETVTNVKAEMARVYRRLAPKIERYKDSFLAGQLYDELENIAELHGAEDEFKRMMAGARNRAHMEYDTNPGGFQNWFWFLPFADETNEGLMKPPTNRKEYLDQRDKLFRMMSVESNPANKQIIKQAIKDLEARYGVVKDPVKEESSTSSEAVEIAVIKRILISHTDLIMQFGLDKVTQAIEEVAYNVGDVDEIGSSDVSAYVAQVKQILGVEA
jgi:hypothetical protein